MERGRGEVLSRHCLQIPKKFYSGFLEFLFFYFSFFLVSVVELRDERFFFNGREFCMAFN